MDLPSILAWRRWLWLLPIWAVLWFSAIQLHLEPFFPSLDSSWLGALSYFAARHFQYGTEVIFTYGPLAYLGTGLYSGYLFGDRIIWELVFKAINAVFLCWVIARLPRVWGAIYLVFCLLFVFPGLPEVSYFFSVTILVIFLLRGSHALHPADIVALVLLAIISLMKYNYLLLAGLGVGCATAAALAKGALGRAGWMAATFVGSFLLSWAWAGQRFGNLGSYLRDGIDVSLGYKEAMGVTASSNLVIVLGLLALAAVFLQLAWMTLNQREIRVSLMALFLAGEMVLNWSHGFIRADRHVVTFFALCPAALITLWAIAGRDRGVKWVLYGSAAFVGLVCLAGLYVQDRSLVADCFRKGAKQIESGWNLIFHEAETERHLKRQLAEQKAQSLLPRVKAEVGQATIDVIGYEQATAILNDLNYTPRPIFQGYTAYTGRLIAANRRFYHSDRAPAYALVKVQTVDDRYPTLDDAAVLKELLDHYAPLLTENGYSLWKRAFDPGDPQPTELTEGTVAFGEQVSIPQNGVAWLELKIEKSILGRLWAIIYKPPVLEIAVKSSNGGTARYRIIPPMAASGFIISPPILTGDDLVTTARGENTSSTMSFAVRSEPGDLKFFQSRIKYSVTSSTRSPKRDQAAAQE